MTVACFLFTRIAVACEQARLPRLRDEPFVVVQEEQVVCGSLETERYGLQTGVTLSAARCLCPALIVLPYDREAYTEAMECVWDLLAVESSVVEPVSPELCFVEMDGGDILERTRRLAAAVAERVGIPVQIGLARTRIVAHHAARQADGGRVLSVPLDAEPLVLTHVSLSSLGKLKPKQVQHLARLGVHTLGDIRTLPPQELHRQFKQLGWLLRRLAYGEDGERVRPLWPPRSLTEPLRFEDAVCHLPTVQEGLRQCVQRLAAQLVQAREFCRSLTLTIESEDSSMLQEKEKLALPCDRPDALYSAAIRLLQRLRIDRGIISLTLAASDLGIGSGVQLTLLEDAGTAQGLPHERKSRLEAALAGIKRRFGFAAIVTASLLQQARRIDLWTYPLTRLLNEPIQVATDLRGCPVRFSRKGRSYTVREIQNRWRETSWLWNKALEKTAWRVETDPSGLYELHQVDVEWRLKGIAD